MGNANLKKMGRPSIQIDFEQLDKLLGLQCTLVEVAGWFDCSEDTIERIVKKEKGMTFAEYFRQKRQKGVISLRRKQYEVAMNGNVALLIWLGKQYLGQTDRIEQENINTEVSRLVIHRTNEE